MIEKLIDVLKKKAEEMRETNIVRFGERFNSFLDIMAISYDSCARLIRECDDSNVLQVLQKRWASLPESYERNAFYNAIMIYNNMILD